MDKSSPEPPWQGRSTIEKPGHANTSLCFPKQIQIKSEAGTTIAFVLGVTTEASGARPLRYPLTSSILSSSISLKTVPLIWLGFRATQLKTGMRNLVLMGFLILTAGRDREASENHAMHADALNTCRAVAWMKRWVMTTLFAGARVH